MNYSLIVPAAGKGSRVGGRVPKQFRMMEDRTILRCAIEPFLRQGECQEVIVAVHPDWVDLAETELEDVPNLRIVHGGSERQDSIRNCLNASQSKAPLVLVHDAARPWLTSSLVQRVVTAAAEHRAAIPGLPVTDTVKRIARDGIVTETVDRSGLMLIQTPQGFDRELLKRAYEEAERNNKKGTDDASLVEAIGASVFLVDGEPENSKITWPHDLQDQLEI